MELKVKHKGKLYSVLIDSEDWSRIKEICSIYITKGGSYGNYRSVRCNMYEGGQIRLARLLLDAPKELQVDHINGNPLDNRRCNVRLATPGQNSAAFQPPRSYKLSAYRGVRYHGSHRNKKWEAIIQKDRKSTFLGYYETQEEAAHAYDAAAKELFGEFAQLNFP